MIDPASCLPPENPGRETATVLCLTRHRRPFSQEALSRGAQMSSHSETLHETAASDSHRRHSVIEDFRYHPDIYDHLLLDRRRRAGGLTPTRRLNRLPGPEDKALIIFRALHPHSLRCLGRQSSPCLGAPAAAVLLPRQDRRRYGAQTLPRILLSPVVRLFMAARRPRQSRMGHHLPHVCSSSSPALVSGVSQAQMSTREDDETSFGDR